MGKVNTIGEVSDHFLKHSIPGSNLEDMKNGTAIVCVFCIRNFQGIGSVFIHIKFDYWKIL